MPQAMKKRQKTFEEGSAPGAPHQQARPLAAGVVQTEEKTCYLLHWFSSMSTGVCWCEMRNREDEARNTGRRAFPKKGKTDGAPLSTELAC